jgi:hypothetical protein
VSKVYYTEEMFSPPRKPKKTLHIKAKYIDYDGTEFGTVKTSFEIQEFSGVKYIQDLQVFPLKYHPDQQAIRDRLL